MYLSTGEIARIFNLNKQTLFYYDKEDIFKPSLRDPKTGYRSYNFNQIYRLALICYLKRIGFTLEQIRDYIRLQNVESTISELKKQSQTLRENCRSLLEIDDVIQRKIRFVEQEMKMVEFDTIQEKYYLRRYYLPLGVETSFYNREECYFYPTIACYHYRPENDSYDITLGAYLETQDKLDPSLISQVRFIESQKFLCFYFKGSYSGIEQKIREVRGQYRHLSLSSDTYNFNIIDQFLEQDVNQYITEIQIPILNPS